MISFEKAKALKKCECVQWEPKEGDCYYLPKGDGPYLLVGETLEGVGKECIAAHGTFAPRLDQLLAEIERRGWWWDLECVTSYYICVLYKNLPGGHMHPDFEADTPEDAAADALLWILKEANQWT